MPLLATLPAILGIPVALLMMLGLAGVVFALFYLINNLP